MKPTKVADCLPPVAAGLLARECAAAADQIREAADRAFAEGMRVGFEHGWEVGYAYAQHEIEALWKRVYETVQRHARMATHAELMERRGEYYDENGVRRAVRAEVQEVSRV